jgi:arylsulfatase A-like enzyme
LQCLKEEGLEEETIVVFTSDHGNCLGIHNQVTKNNHYEESMRIPFLIRWTGRIQSRKDDLLLSVPDLYPTFLDLLGLKEKIPADVEGVSRASLFLDGEGSRPRSQPYIWIPYGMPEWGHRGVRTRRYTLMISRMPGQPDEIVLHDNIKDPFQLENIASRSPETVRQLANQELDPWLRKTGDTWKLPLSS